MNRKVFIILLTMFSFQFFFSCIQEDDTCGDFNVLNYNNSYTGVSAQTFDSSGVAIDEVDKSTFGILISLEIESEVVASSSWKAKRVGFSSAYACSHPEPEYYYHDPIQDIRISMFIANSDEVIDVTNKFIVDNYVTEDNEELSLETLFPIEEESQIFWYHNFNILLTDFTDIPSSAHFEIEVTLESEEVFTNKTELITFTE